MENKKISELLRERDLCLKKIQKESKNFTAYDTLTGNAKPSNNIETTTHVFQKVCDLLKNVSEITYFLRRANVATLTELEDFWGEKMSIVEARQNQVEDKLDGLPSVHQHLKNLYNKILKQASLTNKNVRDHNESHNLKLKKIKETEYMKHEDERKSSREQNIELPNDFESSYDAKIKNIVDAFWTKYKAVQVDPINVFGLMGQLSSWIDLFEKTNQTQINKSNNSEPKFDYDISCYKSNNSNVNTISLEELHSLIQESNTQIENLITRFVAVSWKIGNGEIIDPSIDKSNENYNLILESIKSYDQMKKIFRIVSTFEETNYLNPMTKLKMSSVDMADFKNTVIPVIELMLTTAEQQKKNAMTYVKSLETSVRNETVKLLENSMNSASSRPPADKIKEYTNNLMESIMPKIINSPDIEKQLEKYQKFLDDFDSQIKPAMSTVNANTRIVISWNDVKPSKSTYDWNTIDQLPAYNEPNKKINLTGSTNTTNTPGAIKTYVPIKYSTTTSSLIGSGGRL